MKQEFHVEKRKGFSLQSFEWRQFCWTSVIEDKAETSTILQQNIVVGTSKHFKVVSSQFMFRLTSTLTIVRPIEVRWFIRSYLTRQWTSSSLICKVICLVYQAKCKDVRIRRYEHGDSPFFSVWLFYADCSSSRQHFTFFEVWRCWSRHCQ